MSDEIILQVKLSLKRFKIKNKALFNKYKAKIDDNTSSIIKEEDKKIFDDYLRLVED